MRKSYIKATHSKINGLWATWLRYLLTQKKEQLEKRRFKLQNDMHDSTPSLYLLLLKLQLTICYIPCVQPEFRSLVQYDVTLQIPRKSIGIPYPCSMKGMNVGLNIIVPRKLCPQLFFFSFLIFFSVYPFPQKNHLCLDG